MTGIFSEIIQNKNAPNHRKAISLAAHAGHGKTSITPRHFGQSTFSGSFIVPSGARARTLPTVL